MPHLTQDTSKSSLWDNHARCGIRFAMELKTGDWSCLTCCGMSENRIHHLVISRDRKIPVCQVSNWTVDPRFWIFLKPLNSNDRLFFSYANFTYSCKYLLVMSLTLVFTVKDARCSNQLETANKQHIKQ